MKSKKGSLNLLVEFALFLAVLVIILVMIFTLTGDQIDEYRDGSYSTTCNATGTAGCGSIAGYNATTQVETALAKIPSKLGILATAVIFSVILWVIMRVLPVKIGGTVGGM